MEIIFVLAASYLLGSIPWGLLVGKLTRGVDVRKFGSGATGMTNVMRTLGTKLAVVVLVGDVAKGVGGVMLARWLTGDPLIEGLAAGLVIAGHNWPVFGGFHGGKGVASGVGGLFAISPISGAVAVLVFAVPVALTRYVSLGSVLAVVSAMITVPVLAAMEMLPWGYVAYVATGGPLIIFAHRGNIQRLLNGTERRLGDSGGLRRRRRGQATPEGGTGA